MNLEFEKLKKFDYLRFCKVIKGTKSPYETAWQNKPYTYNEISEHINNGGNYGVLGGQGGVIIIDCDKVTLSNDKNCRQEQYDHELQKAIEKHFPKTLTVQTASGGKHYYFKCPKLKNKIVLKSKRDFLLMHFGEILSLGSQAIGPGSYNQERDSHYKIIQEQDIAEISITKLYITLSPFLEKVQQAKDNAEISVNNPIDSLRITDIFSTTGMTKQGNEYFGKHPIHGSSNGMNFWIDPSKNVWHCFRCGSGGGPAAAIAVKEGIISCSQATRGVIRGQIFSQVMESAKSTYNLSSLTPTDALKDESTLLHNSFLQLWQLNDYKNYTPDNNFIVKSLIYPRTVNMFYSPPGEFKSFFSLYLSLCLSQGLNFLNYPTKQNAVLYCDMENNDRTVKQRLLAIHKGLKNTMENPPLYFLKEKEDIIRGGRLNEAFVTKLFHTINEHDIKIIFFDTIRRLGDFDENSSGDISLLYQQLFKPLVDEFGCTIIFLHHSTKNKESFRGSIDFLGMVDTAYKFNRIGKKTDKPAKVKIVNEKNRDGEIEELIAQIDFDSYTFKDADQEIEMLDRVDFDEIIKTETEKAKSKFQICKELILAHTNPDKEYFIRDYEAFVENSAEEISRPTLKRVLTHLIDNNIFIRNKNHSYQYNEPEAEYKKEDVTEDLS